MKTVTGFSFLGSKITVDSAHSCEKKNALAPWKKSDEKPNSILKRRDIISKCLYSQSYGFTRNHEWMWELDHNKAEFQRIDAFKMWCWIRLSTVPWTARRFNQSMLKEISPEYSLEGPILKLNLQYFGQLTGRTDSWEKTLMQGKIKGRRQIGKTEDEIVGWHHWPDEHESEQAPGVGDEQGNLAYCIPWYRKELDMTETELN